MTKKVFETDKMIAGLPYRKTLFKASRLEDAIKAVVKESTVRDGETVNLCVGPGNRVRRTDSCNSMGKGVASWGDENTLLIDPHHRKCKTWV